jgi:glycosyltransferase involved in cell wall biosynthesis
MKNSVVMIAYYFPPDGSAGVYRPLRFVRQLPTRGWLPSVVTIDSDAHPRPDPRLMDLVPAEVDVVRVSNRDIWKRIQAEREKRTRAQLRDGNPQRVAEARRWQQLPVRRFARRVVRRIEASVYYPDPARFWIRPAVAATVATCEAKQANAILATGGPWSAFLVAREASQRTGVPYVLDFRDSWTLTHNEDFEMWRPRWAARQDRRLLRGLFAGAQSLIFRYEAEAECYWRAYQPALDPAKIHLIPNGYEGAIAPFQSAGSDRCTVLYTGTLTSYRYDTFLDALTVLRDRHPAEARQLRLLFVGEGGADLQEESGRRGLQNMIETREPVPAHEVDRLHREADALLLLGVRPFRGYELAGSKVFGYLKAARPIVGILPRDETRNVLSAVRAPTVADIDRPGDIVSTFRQLLRAWSERRLAELLPDRDACVEFSSERQVNSFVRALEGSPPLTPFVPGRVDIPDSLKAVIGAGGWIN